MRLERNPRLMLDHIAFCVVFLVTYPFLFLSSVYFLPVFSCAGLWFTPGLTSCIYFVDDSPSIIETGVFGDFYTFLAASCSRSCSYIYMFIDLGLDVSRLWAG